VRSGARALARPATEPNAQELVELGVALAQGNPQTRTGVAPFLRACDADEADRARRQHLERSWPLGQGEACARTLLDLFTSSDRRFWCAQRAATTVFVASPSLECSAPISYEGDGP
jgi:hypothetical protein